MKNIKLIWGIIFIIIVLSVSAFLFHQDNLITKENTLKAEVKLEEQGFGKFYQKDGNELCVTEGDKQAQDDISRDMLWSLETKGNDYRKIEKVECKNGQTGIKIK
ncbi:MAG: hypothetical protein WCK31_05310 [bacterium]